ncbi:23S rRNA (pseudouridine(1915)-N(3))-methyltransferase RlmH [Gemmatimonas sp.]|uniref:23S rRNA (pseudouridine(1915)-N(3))-methyltransferase RlmH n=1 Tax=Gemmatimonas sp. TaxID=1962908 RepID=UPI00286EA169|nr:23S rRNA (pseudouridine(1915)-N(3))-methyltransferase RlmH [Gemmatimonas sp.]
MRISLLVIGRPRHAGLADAIRDYETRAARYWPLDVIEVKEESGRGLTPALVMDREAQRLSERISGDAQIIACDPGGESMDSTRFAGWLQEQREQARSVAFVIGGAHGLGESVRSRAARRLSLAPWTLPHEVARLVLSEQLYRAGTIIRGEPYHK